MATRTNYKPLSENSKNQFEDVSNSKNQFEDVSNSKNQFEDVLNTHFWKNPNKIDVFASRYFFPFKIFFYDRQIRPTIGTVAKESLCESFSQYPEKYFSTGEIELHFEHLILALNFLIKKLDLNQETGQHSFHLEIKEFRSQKLHLKAHISPFAIKELFNKHKKFEISEEIQEEHIKRSEGRKQDLIFFEKMKDIEINELTEFEEKLFYSEEHFLELGALFLILGENDELDIPINKIGQSLMKYTSYFEDLGISYYGWRFSTATSSNFLLSNLSCEIDSDKIDTVRIAVVFQEDSPILEPILSELDIKEKFDEKWRYVESQDPRKYYKFTSRGPHSRGVEVSKQTF